MKDAKFYIILVVALAFSVAFSSCGSGLGESISLSKSKIEGKLAYQGEILIDNMIETYKEVQNIRFESEFDGAVANVLSNSDSKYEPKPLVDDILVKKINVLYLYKQALHEYSVLADEGFTGKQVAFANCSQAIVDAIRDLGDEEALAEVANVENLIKSSRYNENAVAQHLSKGLGVLWNKDVAIWNTIINRSFMRYQQAVASIPESAFNEEKLAKYVYQPYEGKHNLAEIYKLNLVKTRRNLYNSFEKRQNNITSSLQYLAQALGEFQKKNFDKDVVMNYLNRIQVILDDNHQDLEQ